MKVALINSECGRGSTGKISQAIAELVCVRGHECRVYYSGNHKSNYSYSVQINNKLDLRAHQLLSRLSGKQGFYSTRATRRLVSNIREFAPDIIHLHNLHGYYLNIKILFQYLQTLDIPIIWTLHDCWAFTGHCTHFDYCGCKKWKTHCKDCEQLSKYPYSWLFDRSEALYEEKKRLFSSLKNGIIVTPSAWLATLAKESYLKCYPVYIIHNGIDLMVFRPCTGNFRQRYDLVGKKVVLGVASVWSERKGLHTMIELSKLLPDNYKVVLVGTDANTEKKLLSNIISIRRTQNQRELAEIYSSADVFINPTLEDNYPTVNMEAISCGCPVITFNTGGSAEMISPENGLVVEKNDIQSLLKNIRTVCESDKFDRGKVSKSASDFNERERNWEYIELYNKAIHDNT